MDPDENNSTIDIDGSFAFLCMPTSCTCQLGNCGYLYYIYVSRLNMTGNLVAGLNPHNVPFKSMSVFP